VSFARIHGDDLRQVGDIAAWRAEATFDPSRGVPLSAWTALAAKRAVLDHVRAWNHSRSYGAGVKIVTLFAAQNAAVWPCNCEPRIERAVNALTPRQQEIIRLVFWCGYTKSEAARELGLSTGTVGNHYFAAMTQLRRMLCASSFRSFC